MKSQNKELIDNLTYENMKMGNFIELLGITPNEITSYIINGTNEEIENIIIKIKGDNK